MPAHSILPFPESANNPAPTAELIQVSPQLAEQWLAQNTNNRNLRPPVVNAYARDMAAGNWTVNGSTVSFAASGKLLDGQHRLHAVVASRATVPLLVVRGLPDAAQLTIDGGAKRTMSDRLRIDNVSTSNTAILASLLRRAVMWERGQHATKGTASPTPTEMYDYLYEHPEVIDSAEFAAKVKQSILAPPSVIAMAYWVTSRVSREDAAWFWSRLADLQDLPSGHPVLVLNQKLTRLSRQTGPTNEPELLAVFIRAWNAYRRRQKVSNFLLPKGGLSNTTFPMPE